ncbi:hypothetical protein BEWA_047080 [Theileria equi strain WA]|uniref:Condensin complex subunit 2 n=1 Tax=Theileria equi strain WA TaxID=1537102 RepID=L1LAG6_THEEQ|nr:hypothetical protein BEWA_047080 [Theileria equi strain WA]EKX72244.1 hypothetical protein BEWA_047080 [Theileria equi strain WA]|eukprot:XP_004831696.1 hypothetical protein BEWA_047080 [Theileria equi strain WA]
MYKLGKRTRPSEPSEGNNKVQITSESVKRNLDNNVKNKDNDTKDQKKSQDLLSLFTSCMTALSTNKICSKNAFEVGIIDHMDDLVQLQGDSEDEDEAFEGTKRVSFTTASRVVEGACKVYGYRVEALYDKTYSVLMNVHSVNKTDAPKATRKSKVSRTGTLASTLAPEAEVTLNELPVDDISLDPYFLKISSLFDQSGAQGLLLNNLIINKDLSINLKTEADVSTGTSLALVPSNEVEGSNPKEQVHRALDDVNMLDDKVGNGIGDRDRSYRSISTTSDFENLQIAGTPDIGELTIEVAEPLVDLASSDAIVSYQDVDDTMFLDETKGRDAIANPKDASGDGRNILVDGQKIYDIIANWSLPLDFKSQFWDAQETVDGSSMDIYLEKLAKMQILPELGYFKRELEGINTKIYRLKNPNALVDEVDAPLEIADAPLSGSASVCDALDGRSSSDYTGDVDYEMDNADCMDGGLDGYDYLDDANSQEFYTENQKVSLMDRLDAIDIEGATKFSFYKKATESYSLYRKTVKPYFIKKEIGSPQANSPKSPECKVAVKSEMSLNESIMTYLGRALVDELDTIELSLPSKVAKKQEDVPDFTTSVYKFDNRFFTTLNVCENRLVKLSNDNQWLFDEERDNPVIQIIYTGPEISTYKSIESDFGGSCYDEYMDCIEGDVMEETPMDVGGAPGESNVSGYIDILKIKKTLSEIIHNQASDNTIDFEKAVKAILERLSQEEKDVLSPHVLFVCLLHVCNEQNLFLQQPEPLHDFQILLNASTEQHAKCA